MVYYIFRPEISLAMVILLDLGIFRYSKKARLLHLPVDCISSSLYPRVPNNVAIPARKLWLVILP